MNIRSDENGVHDNFRKTLSEKAMEFRNGTAEKA